MSIQYGRLSAIRDYWMPRDLSARVEVRVTDLDAVLKSYSHVVETWLGPAQLKALRAELVNGNLSDVIHKIDCLLKHMEESEKSLPNGS